MPSKAKGAAVDGAALARTFVAILELRLWAFGERQGGSKFRMSVVERRASGYHAEGCRLVRSSGGGGERKKKKKKTFSSLKNGRTRTLSIKLTG